MRIRTKKRVAINGLGRIGRLVLNELVAEKNIEVIAVNDLSPIEELEYLLKYDSVHGRNKHDITHKDNYLKVNKKKILVLSEPDAEKLPWNDLNIDLVIECTGLYTKKEQSKKHINAGAKHVIISAPSDNDVKTIVYGVNHQILNSSDEIISAASCTTNCLAPVLKVINDALQVRNGYITTIHAYTNDQVNLDVHHKKGFSTRRGRACAINCIPTSTGAAKAIGNVIPELNGKLAGIAYRVPVSDGSMLDLFLNVKKTTTKEQINKLFRQNVSEVLGYTDDQVVSTDVIGEPTGALIDGSLTDVVSENEDQLIKVTAWYDNEYGYTKQLVRTTKHFLSLK